MTTHPTPRAPVPIDLTDADFDQVSAVMDHVRAHSIYHERDGQVLLVPAHHADEIKTLLVSSRRRTTTDIYAYSHSPNGLQRDLRMFRDRWRERRNRRRAR